MTVKNYYIPQSKTTVIVEVHDDVRIPVMWAGDSGEVGRRRSEATLVAFYSRQVAHMSQE